MSEDYRTEGWAMGAVDSCQDWTAEQHAQVAAELLDAVCVLSVSEDAWNGKPPHRHYDLADEDERTGATVVDPAPLLAALVHVGLARYKATTLETP